MYIQGYMSPCVISTTQVGALAILIVIQLCSALLTVHSFKEFVIKYTVVKVTVSERPLFALTWIQIVEYKTLIATYTL